MASTWKDRSGGSLSEQLRALMPNGQRRSFAPGDVIFSAGDPGDGFYLLVSGRVRISAVVSENESRMLATIGPGDFFGEMAVLDGAPRSASASAETDTTTIFFGRERLLQLLEQDPRLALALVREFSLRIRALNQKYVDEIIQAERLAAIGRFAGTIVHDFKNPLAAISLAAELSCQDGVPTAVRQRAHGRIAQQVQRITHMLNELIEFTRPSGRLLNPVATRFADFMTPLAQELAHDAAERKVELLMENPPPSTVVTIDAQRLSRVFHNLVHNAVDEMRPGGKIFLRFDVGGSELTVSVRDTGRGIPPEIAPSLFQPFASHGKSHGTGLGLSICKKIVEDHHGRIWADSVPGQGATFSFTLPLSRERP